MGTYESLKSVWKKLKINGQIKNFSSKELWVVETESGKAIARRLPPGFKTPPKIDHDAFKRVDKKPIEVHKNWWKIYDVSTAEIFDQGDAVRVSAIAKTAVNENRFGSPIYKNVVGGLPIQLVIDVKRNRKKQIVGYYISELGLVTPRQALIMACNREIDNARPVFPKNEPPYIRTRRDIEIPNNISAKGYA